MHFARSVGVAIVKLWAPSGYNVVYCYVAREHGKKKEGKRVKVIPARLDSRTMVIEHIMAQTDSRTYTYYTRSTTTHV